MTTSPPIKVSAANSKVAAARAMTVPEFAQAKGRVARLAVLTAYDFTMARIFQSAGVDALLVGDSLGMVVQGHANSLAVTMEEMIYHSRMVGAVRRVVWSSPTCRS